MSKPYTPKDRFFQKAKEQRYAARSVFKLEEIDRRFRLFKRQDRVIDLGCAPGSWLQYIAEAVGPKGVVLGYDIVAPTVSGGPTVHFIQTDVLSLTPASVLRDLFVWMRVLEGETVDESVAPPPLRIDAVVSDMAPKLTGVRDADQARSLALATHALEIAKALLSPQGAFAAKFFQGRDTETFLMEVKRTFREVRVIRPEATREGSRETFVVARGKKAPTGGKSPSPS